MRLRICGSVSTAMVIESNLNDTTKIVLAERHARLRLYALMSVAAHAMSGFSGAERGGIRIGDTVAAFAQGPIGLARPLARS